MPSFGYGVIGSTPYRRLRFDSFSQNNAAGAVPPSGAASARSSSRPSHGWSIPTDVSPVAAMRGRGASISHDQVLRNQAVGNT
jgi:hypothetical protein